MKILTHVKECIKALLPKTLKSQHFLDELYSPPIVRSGSFAKMKYGREAVKSSLLPKLIGSYEKELELIIAKIIASNPQVVFDVGAAEGYYAVGLSTRIPECKLYAFETTARGRELINRLAQNNGVANRVEVLGHCTQELFREKCEFHKPSFIIMDIEGGEGELLSSNLRDLVRNAEILVEVHPGMVPGVDVLVKNAMLKTHNIHTIRPEPRSLSDFWKKLGLLQKLLCGKTLLAYMGEGRGNSSYWFHFVPREIGEQSLFTTKEHET